MDTITTLISTLGFPIVVCIALFWFIYKVMSKMTVTLEALGKQMEVLSKQTEENTKMLETLKNKIDGSEKNDK